MSRTYLTSLVAGLAISATALAVPAELTLDVTAPVITATDVEQAGKNTSITVVWGASAVLAAGTANITEVRLVGIDGTGAETAFSVNVPAAAVNAGAFPTVASGTLTINLSNAAVNNGANTFFGTNPASIRVTVSSNAAPADANRLGTQFAATETGALGTRDECLAPLNTAPTLTGAFINAGTLFLQYNRALSLTTPNVTGVNAAGNENFAPVVADFQGIAAPGPFTFADSPANPTGATFGAINVVGGGNNILSIALTVPGTIALGNQIRPASTGSGTVPATATAVSDFLNNKSVQPLGVTITAPPALAVTSSRWLVPVPALSAGTAALRVTFSNPLATAGSANFYKLVTGGAVSTLTTVTGAALDVSDPTGQSVILTVANNTDATAIEGGVGADGLSNTALASYTVQTQGDGVAAVITEPTDIYAGTVTATTASTTAITDGINPTLIGGGPTLLDTNGDGAMDAVALVFNEPIGTTSSSTGFQLNVVAGTTRPFFLIDPNTGALVANPQPASVVPTTPANRIIPITTVATGSVRTGNAAVTARNTNNAVIVSFNPNTFDWDNDGTTRSSATPDANEAVPGTADLGNINLVYNASTVAFPDPNTGATVGVGTVADAAGNSFLNAAPAIPAPAGTVVNGLPNVDGAAPVFVGAFFFTGDNQLGGSNAQFLSETDGTPGDGALNNRVALAFSQTLSQPTPGGPGSVAPLVPSLLQFGTAGATFNDATGPGTFSDFLSRSGSTVTGDLLANNIYTFGTVVPATQLNANLIKAGVALTLVAPGGGTDGGFSDAAANQATFTGKTATDRVAPYSALTTDVNQIAQSGAFLVDASGNGFVDAIRIKFTQKIDSTSLQQADFSLSGGGSLSGAPTVDTADNTIVVLPVTDNVLSINGTVTVTYTSNLASAKLIKAQASPNGNGVAVSATAAPQTITVKALQQPISDTQDIAQQVFTGKLTLDGTLPMPIGTKIFAMLAVPTAQTITATHNNTEFVVSRVQTAIDGSNLSVNAWTNYILQIERDVYLSRNNNNVQTYSNTKVIGDTSTQNTLEQAKAVIRCNANASNLAKITFTGTGETSSDKISGGTVTIAWDVLRSNSGTLSGPGGLYTGGYNIVGQPILSRGVVTDNTGNYSMHVSGPIASFNGKSRLDATNRPIIFVVELPDGRRFAASSLLTSVNGAPVLFRASQGTNTSTGTANQATIFNVNLANIAGGNPTNPANQEIYTGWNTIGYNRVGGWAASSSNLPKLPNGVASTNVVVGSSLPSVNATNQFVLFYDADGTGAAGSGDKMWTAADDFGSAFDGIVLDADTFANFSFTMTDKGVLLGDGINAMVGGYAFGFFNNTAYGPFAASAKTFGIFQFGAPNTSTTSFPSTGSGAFPTNGATKGWALIAAAGSNLTGAGFLTANGNDYAIGFSNNGPNAGGISQIDVTSQSTTATGAAQNLGAVLTGRPLFVHYAAQ